MVWSMVQVGIIREITEKGKKSELMLAWYYRPEEAMGGRKVCSPDRHTDLITYTF